MGISTPELAPHGDGEEEAFQQSCANWVESLIERHDPGGLLGLLPYDPDKYPYQKMDEVFMKSPEPSWDEVLEYGKIGVQERWLAEATEICSNLMGKENYFELVNDIADQPINGRRGAAMALLWGRMNLPNQNMAVMMFHSKIIAMPVLLTARANAFNGLPFARKTRFKNSYRRFDLFEYSRQNFTIVNAAIARMGLRQPSGELIPVMEEINKFTNVVKVVPPTKSSKEVGIPKEVRRRLNEESMLSFGASLDTLSSQNKSAVLTIDPTGSTAEHIYDEDRLIRLEHKRVNPLAARLIQDRFRLVFPSLLWWDKNPQEAGWYLGQPESLNSVSPKSSGASRIFNSIKDNLADAEAQLSGAEVSFRASTIGQLAAGVALRQIENAPSGAAA